jgi:hypothetical protein
VKVKSHVWLPVLLMVAFAATRWPGLLPQNFSAAYALVFCAGVYFVGRLAWWLPLGTLLLTDVALNCYYAAKGWAVWNSATLAYQLAVYAAYIAILCLGRRFKPKSSFVALLSGGVLGALLFYIITNTASWLFNPFGNPEYTKDFTGWLTALITGTKGWPQTWEFLRNTLLSGGLFTGLFAGAMKLTASESAREKEAPGPAEENEPTPDAEPEEAHS